MALKISNSACLLILSVGFMLPSAAAPIDNVKPATQVVQTKHTTAKTQHKVAQTKHRRIAYYNKNFLVPPPPPYTPSMLPELQYSRYSQYSQRTDSAEAGNPYSKYVYTRSGYEAPKPVQPNKYVTYWANKT
jgi:hypothetical protein